VKSSGDLSGEVADSNGESRRMASIDDGLLQSIVVTLFRLCARRNLVTIASPAKCICAGKIVA